MNDSRYPEIGLYYHNADSYDKVRAAYESGEKVVGIVHATGTGKSFNALQLALDNKDKKIVYVVPSKGIIDHLKEIINSNPNLDFDRDFPNLEFRTYQSFISLEKHEIEDINCDLLILDEFHHIGAPVWGARINTMIETHPNMRVFGMTAYTVRDRGTSYERDMADPDTDELFSRKIVSRYDLCNAIIEGVLPKPIYRASYIHLMDTAKRLEERVLKLSTDSKNYRELMAILSDVKKRIHEAPSIPNLLKKQLKPNGKYIYFCPPVTEEGANDIETIKEQAMEWFKEMYPGKEIVFYTSTSEMGIEGKHNRDAFYKDETLDGKDASDTFRIMFAINQYNEGIHAPNIDGVILGRGTCSDIVFFEQLGRALSVRGNTKDKFDELEKYSVEELIKMCMEKGIPIEDAPKKEDLIEKLISPVVIDLTNNIDFIKELENNLRDRLKLYEGKGLGKSRAAITDASFDIEMYYYDLFVLLKYVMDRLTMTWDDYYELAKAYYEKNHNLNIPTDFKTINGVDYDENGVNLFLWKHKQIAAYRETGNTPKLDADRIKKLEDIGMIWDANLENWLQGYELAKAYYENYGNLIIERNFHTKDGVNPSDDEDAFKLGDWIHHQRMKYKKGKLEYDKVKMLEDIGMIWDRREAEWIARYNLAKAYYEHYGNLSVPKCFFTKDGVNPSDDEDAIDLNTWIQGQRKRYQKGSLVKDKDGNKKIQMLEEIGMIWKRKEELWDDSWIDYYELAEAYYKHHKNLLVPSRFKTKDGVNPSDDEDAVKLGKWINSQRTKYMSKKISKEKIELLEEIGMVWQVNVAKWLQGYMLAKAYYEHYGKLIVPLGFKTKDGINKCDDKDAIDLQSWISHQRRTYKGKGNNVPLTEEQIKMLEDIGMVWDASKKKK